MNKADCFKLGHVAKLHGYKGEVSLFLDTKNPEKFSELEFIFIEINGNLTPFFIESLQMKNKGMVKVKFEGIDDETDAKSLLKKNIYVPLSSLPASEDNEEFNDFEFIGFKVVDKNFGDVGKVEQFIDLTNNPLFQVFNEELQKEVLLPLAGDIIQKIDRANRVLHIEAPEGLIELYLED